MSEAASPVDGGCVDVFATVTHLKDNPYAGLWTAALEGAGACVQPLSARALLRARRRGRGWVNLQWPEWVLNGAGNPTGRVLRFLATVATARVSGHRVLLTVHNVRGHRGHHRFLEAVLWRSLAVLATHVHTFTDVGADDFVRRHPAARRARRVTIPHGDYRPVVGAVPDREAARATFGWAPQDRVVLVFGALRAYKGLSAVVDAVRADPAPERRLLVCGAPADDQTRHYLAGLADDDPRITVVPRFLEQEQLTRAIAAADLVVLPYRRVTNSGSAVMALSAGCPVVLPRTPIFSELRERVGPDWVRLYDGELSAAALAPLAPQRDAGGVPDMDWCSWDHVRALLTQLFTTGDVSAQDRPTPPRPSSTVLTPERTAAP